MSAAVPVSEMGMVITMQESSPAPRGSLPELCTFGGIALADMIRRRKVSAEEVMATYLDHIGRTNPAVNAIISLRPRDELLAEAREADDAVARGKVLGPLHGVPQAIKDLALTRGLLTTFGSHLFADFVPDEDAIIVERMRAAGALIIGKTNVPEYGYGSNSYNPLFGLTRNARRCDRHYRRLERAVLESYIGETAREIFRMARVFVTGSADGLGKMAAELLIEQGYKVVLHARSAARAEETRKKVGGAEHIVVGDLSSIAETKSVADQVNRLGRFDAVIHNAGIGYREPKLVKTVDGLPQLFAVNTLAPYLLTALITMPKRLVYLSSGMHYGAGSHLDDMLWEKRRWNGSQAYAETKFHDVLLSFAVARLFPEVKSNSLEPGWVPTKMGGAGAPDDIEKAHRTQVWLATSDEPAATVSGRYFFHQKLRDPDPATKDVERQYLLLDLCRKVSGIALSAP